MFVYSKLCMNIKNTQVFCHHIKFMLSIRNYYIINGKKCEFIIKYSPPLIISLYIYIYIYIYIYLAQLILNM